MHYHEIPRWLISGHLSCLPLPASVALYDSSFAEIKSSVGDFGCYSSNYKLRPFSTLQLLNITINIRCYQLWSGHCKICSCLQKKCSYLEELRCKEKPLNENLFFFNQNQDTLMVLAVAKKSRIFSVSHTQLMSRCAGAGREPSQAASPGWPMERLHTKNIMLSL